MPVNETLFIDPKSLYDQVLKGEAITLPARVKVGKAIGKLYLDQFVPAEDRGVDFWLNEDNTPDYALTRSQAEVCAEAFARFKEGLLAGELVIDNGHFTMHQEMLIYSGSFTDTEPSVEAEIESLKESFQEEYPDISNPNWIDLYYLLDACRIIIDCGPCDSFPLLANNIAYGIRHTDIDDAWETETHENGDTSIATYPTAEDAAAEIISTFTERLRSFADEADFKCGLRGAESTLEYLSGATLPEPNEFVPVAVFRSLSGKVYDQNWEVITPHC